MADIYGDSPDGKALLSALPKQAYYADQGPEQGFLSGVVSGFSEVSANNVTDVGLVPNKMEVDAFRSQSDLLGQVPQSGPPELLQKAADWKDTVDQGFESYDRLLQREPETAKALQAAFPNLGFKTYDEVKKSIDDQHAQIERNYQSTIKNSSFSGKVGSFVGALGGFLTDPINVAATAAPLGLGFKGATAAQTFTKVFAAEDLVNTTLAALSEKNVVANRELIGQETTPLEQGVEVGVQGLIGGAIGGAIGAASHMFNPITKATIESVNTLDKAIADGVPVPQEARTAVEALKGVIEEVKGKPPEMDQTQYLGALEKANSDLIAGKEVDVSAFTPKAEEIPSTTRVEPAVKPAEAAPADSTPFTAKTVEDHQDAVIEAMRQKIAAEGDIEIPDIHSIEGETTRNSASLQQLLKEHDINKAAYERLRICMSGGGGE